MEEAQNQTESDAQVHRPAHTNAHVQLVRRVVQTKKSPLERLTHDRGQEDDEDHEAEANERMHRSTGVLRYISIKKCSTFFVNEDRQTTYKWQYIQLLNEI